MRHRNRGRKLGRKTGPRKALMTHLVNALLTHGRIVTTLPKAKEARPVAEKLITLARKGALARERGENPRFLHCYRRAISALRDKALVKKLFSEIAPAYRDRAGGYTRILRDSGVRLGDAAEKAIFELVEMESFMKPAPEAEKKAAKKPSRIRKRPGRKAEPPEEKAEE